MTGDTQPEAMDLADWLEAVGGGPSAKRCAALLREQHARIAELESELEAVGAGGVQALSAGPVEQEEAAQRLRKTLDIDPGDVNDPLHPRYIAGFKSGHAAGRRRAAPAASPTPPAEEQAAPKAAPGVGNSGFDHQTAADFLNGKTVSDEAVRTFVAASRWAHDERAALSATLLAMHGVLTSREAEIALLKKALMEAEAAPQPSPAPLSEMPYEKRKAIQEGEQIGASDAWFKARHEMLDTVDRRNVFRAGFDRGWSAALAAQGGK